MKKLTLLLLAFVCVMPLRAQSVNADYDRNALTVIAIHHNDRYDAITDAYLKRYFPGGEKFDNNMIQTRYLPVNYARFEEREGADLKAYMREHNAGVVDLLKKEDVARQIVAKWFNRSVSGTMDLNLINQRADYNATDQTFNIASAQALGEYLLHGEGLKLVDNSYVLVVDHSVPVRREDRNSSNNQVTRINYSVHAIGYLYKLSFGDLQRQAVYDQWIYTSDDEAARKVKRANWEMIQFPLFFQQMDETLHSAGIDPSRTSNESQAMEEAIQGSPAAVIDKLEKKVEAWKVKTAIYKTHPILSKVGTKEGIKNMSRFEVLEYMLDAEGNIGTRRKGFVRATTVANNTRAGRGQSPVSQFYQIAGTKLEPGMLLKEKKSANLDVKALYYSGASKGYGAELDMIFGMSNSGSCSHVRIAGTFYTYKEGTSGPVDAEGNYYYLKAKLDAIGVRMGYGYGLRPFRQLEFIPGAYILADYLNTGDSSSESEQTMLRKMGWGLEAGVDMNLTIFYPVKINAGAFYTAPVLGGDYWRAYSEVLKNVGQNRMGFTWRAGLVYEF